MGWGHGIAAWGLAALLAVPSAVLAQTVPDTLGTVEAPTDQPVAPIVVETPPPNGDAVLPVLTLDQDALYLRSQWGQRVQDDLELRGREIAAENDRMANQFTAEEQELTSLRQTLPPDEFRKRADEFDKRVVEVRRERDAAARTLQSDADEERQAFFHATLPVLAALMRERGAVVVLDQRAIFVASQSIDVTDVLIERIDREIGAGPAPEEPEADTPDEAASEPEDPGTGPAEGGFEEPAISEDVVPAVPGPAPAPTDE
ncbi:OmpH family outer membrane protein [Paracoccus methylovorus]|uniref:OmpH family outer membrane protein n=1 Tax=Paracoccus methylovorus TaxID=2812658 RepID=A0ABX7JDE2_9RHOB|nr:MULTISPECIES: OmpH family outer membrane protein [Paracoccus]QRZ12247.1 OmpH family outer membrane protein [Paracoccus methylovorus]